jgi:lipid-A-disaccharide synthase
MKYYLVAGEASGDLHGANLMKELKKRDPDAEFRFFGGDLMLAEGGTLVKHYSEMAYMGLVEVIVNLPAILKNIKQCKADIKAWQPDVLILIENCGLRPNHQSQSKLLYIAQSMGLEPEAGLKNQKNCRSSVLHTAL